MIVVHGETLWSPAPQAMDDNDDDKINIEVTKNNEFRVYGSRTKDLSNART